MRYYVAINGTETAIDVTPVPGGGFDVRVEGRRMDADVVQLADALSVRIGNHVLDLTVEGKPPRLGVIARGQRVYVDVESERMRAASNARGARGDTLQGAILSPMPGRIVKILASEGDDVQSGDALIVVEAMKMENELRAPRSGSVAKVHVSVGDRVEASALLIELT
jgi:biotin carboxyl carrier protein